MGDRVAGASRGVAGRRGRVDRRQGIPGYIAAVVSAGIVVAAPVFAHLVDTSADTFNASHAAVGPATGWALCALLTAVVVTRRMQIAVAIEEGAGLAVAYDALPYLLVAAWVIGGLALLTGHWLLAIAAAGLCVFHVHLLVPRLTTARTPSWVARAPRVRVGVANVYVDNETPDSAARQLVAAAVDVVVLVESTARFMRVFDDNGGGTAYPNRVSDPDDESDYAVTIATPHTLGPRSEFRQLGELRLAIADIDVDGTSTLVVALNPMATVDPGGHMMWKEQIRVLREFIPTLEGPVIIAGDLNTTRYRPEFEQILALGFSDAIDSLGKGLNPSFKLSSDGLIGALGPVARLDHALVNAHMHAVALHNLEACGSDHLPFVLDIAVRTDGPPQSRTHRRRTPSNTSAP